MTRLTATYILQRCSYVYLRIHNPHPHISTPRLFYKLSLTSHLRSPIPTPESPSEKNSQIPNPPSPPALTLVPLNRSAGHLTVLPLAYLSFPRPCKDHTLLWRPAAAGVFRASRSESQRSSVAPTTARYPPPPAWSCSVMGTCVETRRSYVGTGGDPNKVRSATEFTHRYTYPTLLFSESSVKRRTLVAVLVEESKGCDASRCHCKGRNQI
jgi:hypothetical protein